MLRLCAITLAPVLALAANQYAIVAQADRNLNVRGTVRITWTNDTGKPASEIPVQCSCKMKRVGNNRVALPQTVAPGGAATVEIEFEESAKKSYGYHMLTGAWHPKALTFRKGAYSENQQQADDYDVTLAAPDSLIVASAGELVSQSPRRWRLPHSTSFGLAASPDFVETRRTSEGVEIRLFQLRGDARFDPRLADHAADAIAFYKELFGFYPQPALVMLPGDFKNGGGYTPASGITVYHRITPDYQRWISAHEIAHQYWGFDTVIDDGDYHHWPGLALGIATDLRCVARHEKASFPTGRYRDAVAKGLDTTIRRPLAEMRKLHFDWNNIISHQKAYAVVRMLEDLLGEERFVRLLKTLQERYRYRLLSFDDFQKVTEELAGRKLDWFFHDWVDTNAVAGFAVESMTRSKEGVEVAIRRTGAARFPVEVRLTMADGTQLLQRIAYEPEVQTLLFDVKGEPQKVDIDPRNRCPRPAAR